MKPPRIARLLLRALLPPPERSVVVGDLDEEFRRDVFPARGSIAGRLWYWRQVVSSVPYALRLRVVPAVLSIAADAGYALRMWRRHPAFAMTVISTQAIGIAVATAVMAVAYAVLLRPLPYLDAGRIVQITESNRRPTLSYQDYMDLRRTTRSFEAIAGFSGGSRTLTAPGAAPERVPFVEVTDGFFEVLGVQPVAGRAISEADVKRGAPPVVMISHGAWMRRFGGDPAVVGRTLQINGQSNTIIGVLPEHFEFPLRGLAELWMPLTPSQQQEERGYWHWMDVVGRVKSDVTTTSAAADLQRAAQVFAQRDPKFHSDAQLQVTPLRDVIVGGVRPTVHALLAGVVLIVLATCATIASLLLSRASSRTRELSVRTALGAGRSRLISQMLTENVMLSFGGGVAGIVAGGWLLSRFVAAMPAGRRASLPHFDEVGVGGIVAASAMALSLLTGVLFGLLPAWRASRNAAASSLKGNRSTEGKTESRARSVLVAVQVAVALVLLSVATLLGTSMYRLLNVAPGFDPRGLVTMRINLPDTYRDLPAVNAFHDRLRERLQAIPGVTAVAAINQPPLTGRGDNGSPSIVERPLPPGQLRPGVGLRAVSANYFSAMRIPVMGGRAFAETDAPGTPPVVVVNQLLADQVFTGADPIGQHITFEFASGKYRIVGIVGNEQFDDMDRPLMPVVYFAARQGGLTDTTLMVRTSEPSSLPAAARAALAEIDPSIPLFGIQTIDQITDASAAVFLRRTAVWLLGIFAFAAVLLAAMGLYGVLAQAVADRTREIGVRVALGATRGSISALILRRGLVSVALGLTLGVAGTLVVSRLLVSLLFGVRPADPLIVSTSAAALACVAVLACMVPARRAIRIDPATAVRLD